MRSQRLHSFDADAWSRASLDPCDRGSPRGNPREAAAR